MVPKTVQTHDTNDIIRWYGPVFYFLLESKDFKNYSILPGVCVYIYIYKDFKNYYILPGVFVYIYKYNIPLFKKLASIG